MERFSPKEVLSRALDFSPPRYEERELTRADIENMFPDSPLAELAKTGRISPSTMLQDRGARAAAANVAALGKPRPRSDY